MNWVKRSLLSGDSKVSYLYKDGKEETILIVVPGMLSEAEDYSGLFDDFEMSTVIVESCIADDAADMSFAWQIAGIRAVTDIFKNRKCILMGHSAGAALAIMAAYLSDYIRAVVMIDYVPAYPKLSEEWRERAVARKENRKEAIDRYVDHSERVDLSHEFSNLTKPVYLLKAELSRYLHETAINKMTTLNPELRVVILKGCDHDLNGETDSFKRVIQSIIDDHSATTNLAV